MHFQCLNIAKRVALELCGINCKLSAFKEKEKLVSAHKSIYNLLYKIHFVKTLLLCEYLFFFLNDWYIVLACPLQLVTAS